MRFFDWILNPPVVGIFTCWWVTAVVNAAAQERHKMLCSYVTQLCTIKSTDNTVPPAQVLLALSYSVIYIPSAAPCLGGWGWLGAVDQRLGKLMTEFCACSLQWTLLPIAPVNIHRRPTVDQGSWNVSSSPAVWYAELSRLSIKSDGLWTFRCPRHYGSRNPTFISFIYCLTNFRSQISFSSNIDNQL